jgi:hypothetical protein
MLPLNFVSVHRLSGNRPPTVTELNNFARRHWLSGLLHIRCHYAVRSLPECLPNNERHNIASLSFTIHHVNLPTVTFIIPSFFRFILQIATWTGFRQ